MQETIPRKMNVTADFAVRAQSLLEKGEVKFICLDHNTGVKKSVFADINVLMEKSRYFEKRMQLLLSGSSHNVGFTSGFAESVRLQEEIKGRDSADLKGSHPFQIIDLCDEKGTEFDFIIVYTLLFYLYTNKLGLSSFKHSLNEIPRLGQELKACDESRAMDLYSLSEYWDVPGLREDILLWLKLTVDSINIFSFYEMAALYDEIYEIYKTYQSEHKEDIERYYWRPDRFNTQLELILTSYKRKQKDKNEELPIPIVSVRVPWSFGDLSRTRLSEYL